MKSRVVGSSRCIQDSKIHPPSSLGVICLTGSALLALAVWVVQDGSQMYLCSWHRGSSWWSWQGLRQGRLSQKCSGVKGYRWPRKGLWSPTQSCCVLRQMSKILSVFTSAIKDLWCALAWCSTAYLHVKFWPTNELADSHDFEKKEAALIFAFCCLW